MEESPSNRNKIKSWLPGVLISLIALFIVFRLTNWSDLKSAFLQMNPVYLGISIVILVISLGFRAQAWRTLLRRQASLWQTYKSMCVGYLINNLFPLRAGELGRAIFLGQITNLGPFHVLSTIVLERSFDLIFAAIFLLSTLPLALGLDWARPVAITTLIVVILMLLTLYLVAKYHEKVSEWVKKIGHRWGFVEKYILPSIDSFLSGLSVLTDLKQFSFAVIWMLLAWLSAILVDYLLLIPFVPNAQLWWAAFVLGVLSVGVAIPSAPAALGVYEASVVAALSILNIPYSNALAYGIIVHFFSVFVTSIFGMIGLVQEGQSFSTILSDIRVKKPVTQAPVDSTHQE